MAKLPVLTDQGNKEVLSEIEGVWCLVFEYDCAKHRYWGSISLAQHISVCLLKKPVNEKVLRCRVSRELSFPPACLHVILYIFQLTQGSKWKIHYLRTSSEFVKLPGDVVPINHVGSLSFLTDIRDNLNLMYTSSIIKCKLLIYYKYPVFSFFCFTSKVSTTYWGKEQDIQCVQIYMLCPYTCVDLEFGFL